jgi:type II secretory ATPase GspE/PulE/Tfp pilus assembly ATPase PilB-like protein
MLSSEGSQIDTATTRQQMFTSLQTHLPPGTDHEQVFLIMDSLLSFEVCLHHQIVPLNIEENNILVGMVHPADEDALNYVKPILSYMNLKMVVQLITDESHRATMSAYLNYKNTIPFTVKEHPSLKKLFSKNPAPIITETLPNTDVIVNTQSHSKTAFIGVSPESRTGTRNPLELAESLLPVPDADDALSNSNCLIPLRLADAADVVSTVEIPQVFSPVEVLATLPAKQLLEELLGRILAGGIGRLYLERQSDQGRILWSDNGVLQSVLDKLPLSIFQGVLNELKQITALPNTNATEVQQREKEFLYQQKRLLLRLRVMPGTYGQEATLQVLRGAALKFYQQQKLTHLSRNTIETIQQLARMLRELQDRLLLDSDPNMQQLKAINNLSQLMERVDREIKILTDQNLPPENS